MEVKEPSLFRAYSIYGALLTDRQREMFEDYFGLDLSLGEIAEIRGVSRQAVKDALSHAEKQLVFYEEKLGICARSDKIAGVMAEYGLSDEIKKKIEDILEGR